MSKIIFIIFVAVVIVAAIYCEKRRGDDMSQLAKQLGFDFHPGQHRLPVELDEAGFDLFTQGPPNIRNRMHGMRGSLEITLFDFSYAATTAGEGQRSHPVADDYNNIETRNQSVVWIRSTQSLPDFDLSPRRIHRRSVASRFGLQQVTFDGNDRFNQQHILLARDGERVRALFNQALFDFLAEHPHLVIESRGQNALIYRFEKLPDPTSVPQFLDDAVGLLELFQQSAGKSLNRREN